MVINGHRVDDLYKFAMENRLDRGMDTNQWSAG